MANLYLMSASLDMVNLARFAAERRHSDPDRTAHCLFTESFGKDHMPKPFVIKTRVSDGEMKGTLLAYTPLTAEELEREAVQRQMLAHSAVMHPSSIRTVGVPAEWVEGSSIRFEIRVRPTKRRSSRAETGPGAEQDIYLEAPEDSSRAEIYCRWLSEMMQRQGGVQANPDSMEMTRFAMRRVRRQNLSRWITGPDATIAGAATVANPDRMRLVLAHGIGRHKGYGYGMLLVRPG